MTCPYLASNADPSQRFENPSSRNVCYGERPKKQLYVEIPKSHQQGTCFSDDAYPECRRYKQAIAKKIKTPAEGVELAGRRWWWPFG